MKMNDTQPSQHAPDQSGEVSPTSSKVFNVSLKGNNSQDNDGAPTIYSSSDHEVPLWSSSEGSSDDDSSSSDASVPAKTTNGAKTMETITSEDDDDSNSEYEEANESDSEVEVESSGGSDNDEGGGAPRRHATTPQKGKKKKAVKKKKQHQQLAASPKKSAKKKTSSSTSNDKNTTSSTKSSLPTINLDGSEADDDNSIDLANETNEIAEIPLFSDIRKTLDSSVGNISRSNLPYFSSSPMKSPSRSNLGYRQMSTPNFRVASSSPAVTSSPAKNSKPEFPRSLSVSNVGARTSVGTTRKVLSIAKASDRFRIVTGDSSDSIDSSLDDELKTTLMEMALGTFKTPQSTKPKLNLNQASNTDFSSNKRNNLKKSVSMSAATMTAAAPKKSSKKPKKPTSLVEMGRGKNNSNDKAKKKKKKNTTRSAGLSSLTVPMSPNTAKDLIGDDGKNPKGKLQKSVSISAVTMSSSSKSKKTKKPKSMSKLPVFEDGDSSSS
jgi:hypothetical protein